MKNLFLAFFLISSFAGYSQTLTTYSAQDVNHDNEVNINDVTNVVKTALEGGTSSDVVVSVKNVESLLNQINTKLDYVLKGMGYTTLFENGYEYADLGITNSEGKSIMWATCNLGSIKAEDAGYYIAWAETSPKTLYGQTTYKYKDYIYTTWKYSSSSGKTVLDSDDDAATYNMGGNWRIPTKEEWQLLYDNCNMTYTTMNGVNGIKVTSKNNGNFIFLPCAGEINKDNAATVNNSDKGYYWSSSMGIASNSPFRAIIMSSGMSLDQYSNNPVYLYYGLQIRPVFIKE